MLDVNFEMLGCDSWRGKVGCGRRDGGVVFERGNFVTYHWGSWRRANASNIDQHSRVPGSSSSYPGSARHGSGRCTIALW